VLLTGSSWLRRTSSWPLPHTPSATSTSVGPSPSAPPPPAPVPTAAPAPSASASRRRHRQPARQRPPDRPRQLPLRALQGGRGHRPRALHHTSREMTFHLLRFWALVSIFFASGSRGRISPGWSYQPGLKAPVLAGFRSMPPLVPVGA